MRPPRFHPEARRDFDEAFAFLAEGSPAAAGRFGHSVRESLERIAEFPHSGRTLAVPVHPFSHDLVYRVEPDGQVTIVAVAHHRRRPGYWRHRAK